MTQIASLLALATVFVGFMWISNIYILDSEKGGAAYTRDKTTYVGT
jgi:hypothetical protein